MTARSVRTIEHHRQTTLDPLIRLRKKQSRNPETEPGFHPEAALAPRGLVSPGARGPSGRVPLLCSLRGAAVPTGRSCGGGGAKRSERGLRKGKPATTPTASLYVHHPTKEEACAVAMCARLRTRAETPRQRDSMARL